MTLLSGNSDGSSSSSNSSSHGGRSSFRSSDFVIAALTVASFLWLLPALLTYAHLRHELHATEMEWLVVVGKHEPGLYGRRVTSKSGNFNKLHWPHRAVWDVVQLSQMLQSLAKLPTTEEDTTATIKASSSPQRPYLVPAAVANQPDNAPCLHQSDGSMICHGNLVAAIHTRSSRVVPSWNGNQTSATTTLSTTPLAAVTALQRHEHDNSSPWMRLACAVPATSILVMLLVGCAYFYWHYHVPVASVALVYAPLQAAPYEVWRTLTGTMAHFEAWHLLLNVQSLVALGHELEGRRLYSPLTFFLYNVSLIPIVASLWWLLQRSLLGAATSSSGGSTMTAQSSWWWQRWRPLGDVNRPTVGYSGVLFAWMVVASLEQPTTCPLVFLPKMCFATVSYGPLLRFNWAPIVQLLVLQILLPRASFTGHLAGIVAGFLLHWGLLPLRFVQPALWIPCLYLLYLYQVRRIVPPSAKTLDSLSASSTDDVSRQRVFVIFRWQLMTLLLSSTVLGMLHSLTWSLAAVVLYWHCLRHSLPARNDDTATATTAASVPVWAKGFVISAVLVLIYDAMTLGSWLALYEAAPLPILVLWMRAVVLLGSMVAVQDVIPHDVGGGVYEWALGLTTLHPCRRLASHAWMAQWMILPSGSSTDSKADIEVGSKWVPFSGGGNRLGDR
jgi:membrane associated rhomboid family serine protease